MNCAMNSFNTEVEALDSFVEIDVLLATYNGARYLQQQLESLFNQMHVAINLFVSDDGSSDNTIEIIQNNSSHFKSLVFLNESPRKGPAANFIYLMKNFKGDAKYIALMDQDDIWHPNHLFSSVKELEKFGENATLTFSSCTEFEEEHHKTKLWPHKSFNLDKHFIYFENPSRGCTMVLNRRAMELVRNHNPLKIIMHDWWLLILINELGNVNHIQTPNISYRIHSNNHTGRNSNLSRILQIFILLNIKNWKTINQIKSISSEIIASGQKTSSEMEGLVRLLEYRNLKNRFKILTLKKKLRASRLEDLILRVLLLTIP
jgi:glycosyltransferase involved in cell wall biosynthesis